MHLTDIEAEVTRQAENWQEHTGRITGWDVDGGVITVGGTLFTLNDNAQKQMWQRLGIVGVYNSYKPEDGVYKVYDDDLTDLRVLQQNIDWCIRHRQKTDTLIIYDQSDNEAKCVKSDRYQRLKNLAVFNKAIEIYPDTDMFNADHSYINDKRMYLSFGSADSHVSQLEIKETGMQQGDLIGMGCQVWNNEVGLGSAKVGQFLIRLACANGMTSRRQIDLKAIPHIHKDMIPRLDYAMRHILDVGNMEQVLTRALNRPAIVETLDNEQLQTITKIPIRHFEGIRTAHEQEPVGVSPQGINGYGVLAAVTRYNSHIFPGQEDYSPYESQELMHLAYPLLTL